MSDAMVDERVTDEIEALKAILLDNELNIKENDRGEPEYIETILFPSTGEDSQSQYVCVTLIVRLPLGYPDVSPAINLRNPRGLDEDTVKLMQSDAEAKCKDFIGQPVMFELIELIREHLTRSNLPTDQCAVCLYGFREGDEFTKTECYHYFHSHCLAAHVAAAERYYREEQEKLPQWQQDTTNKFQAICPVCRESINCDVESLWSAPPPIDVEAATDFSVTAELRELQKQMSALYLRQQQRGGIIDLEAEGVKMLVRTEDDPAATTEEVSPPGTSLNAYSNTTTVQSVTQVISVKRAFSLVVRSIPSSRRTTKPKTTIIRSTNRVKCSIITATTIIIMVTGTEVAVGPITDATLTELDKRNLLPDDNGLVTRSPLESGLIPSSIFR
ncbi:E3 ubiquitin-protein ligase RNF25 isoform X1 [Formica exsecta]|uniref:E3 ubiquitin-protein ligase RNF25 isoform X1 n=2 Tax=Formica exsecta TaxID=72781 RepID=UPI0011426A3A|nr:E3 ubiquitin-protein ligase RNF25 isoform X1 [Formica exsecta]